MLFSIVKGICILMAMVTIVTLFRSKLKLLGKILGTIVAVIIAFSPNGGSLITQSVYGIANFIMLITTLGFKRKFQDKDRKRD